MIITTFKRRGYTDTVTTFADNLYIEYHHLTGTIKIEQYYEIMKEWKGKKYPETHSKVLYYGNTNYKGDKPINAITEIENLIKEYTDVEIKFNDYVLAYDTRTNFYNKIYPYLNLDRQPEEINITV